MMKDVNLFFGWRVQLITDLLGATEAVIVRGHIGHHRPFIGQSCILKICCGCNRECNRWFFFYFWCWRIVVCCCCCCGGGDCSCIFFFFADWLIIFFIC